MKTKNSKVQDLFKKIEEGIKAVTSSEEWKRVLDFQARFHNYSFNNTLLILSQCPHASYVAGYRDWQKRGRQVKKGEKGIYILAPLNVKDKETDEYKIVGFRSVAVFDISQTSGDDIPEVARKLTTDNFAGIVDAVLRVIESEGVSVTFESIPGRSNGYYDSIAKKIVIEQGLAKDQQVKTLIHELAHHLLHGAHEDKQIPREQKEIEAESVAYIVCSYMGLDSAEYSFGYVAQWGSGLGSVDILRQAGSRIQKTAADIIGKLEASQKEVEKLAV